MKIYQYSNETIADEGYFYNLLGQNLYINLEAIIGGDLTVKGDAEFVKNVDIGGEARVSGNFFAESNGEITGELTVADKITGKYIIPNEIVTKGSSCLSSLIGFIARTSKGEAVSCVSKTATTQFWEGGADVVNGITTTGNVGVWDMCAITKVGNAEDSHYCRVVKQPDGSWIMNQYKTGCTVSCLNL